MKKVQANTTLNSILEAARIEMSKHGFANTTVEQITNRANVGKGTFYLYFKTKEDVVKSMMEEMFEKVKVILEDSQERLSQSGSHFKEIINQTIYNTLREYYELRDIIITVYHANFELSKELFLFRSGVFNRLRQCVENIIQTAQEKGFIRPIEPALLSHMLFSIFMNLSIDVLFKEGVDRLPYYVNIMTDFILYGILASKETDDRGAYA